MPSLRSLCVPLVVTIVAVPSGPTAAVEFEQLTTKLLAKESPGRLVYITRIPSIVLPTASPESVGAAFEIFNPTTGEIATFSLPIGPSWTTEGGGSAYRFRNPDAPFGGSEVKVALIKEGQRLKVVAKSAGITLDEPTQGGLGTIFTVGSDRYCSLCTAPTNDDPGIFKQTACTAPSSCRIKLCGNFLVKWGTGGAGDGQFSNPEGIAVDGSGNVYVADAFNDRVQKFDPSGIFLATLGGPGTGDGEFNTPYGVAIGSGGNVYVSDIGNHRIQIFDAAGMFLGKWGSAGTGDGEFGDFPRTVATDGDGNVYVVDYGNHRIQKFDASGTFLSKWGSAGIGDGQFQDPHDIAVHTSGNIYVADFGNHRVQKFDSSAVFLTKWGSEGTSDGQFMNLTGIAVDGGESVYAVDETRGVQKFDASGTFVTKWGRGESTVMADGIFSVPTKAAIDPSGNIYVADRFHQRIQRFGCP